MATRCEPFSALALHDDVRLYALDAHFRRISELTGLRLSTPGDPGMFVPDGEV